MSVNGRLCCCVIIALAVMVSSCSTESSAQGSTRATSACSLLPASDVAKFLVHPVHVVEDHRYICSYVSRPGEYMTLDMGASLAAFGQFNTLWKRYRAGTLGTGSNSMQVGGFISLWQAYPSSVGGGGRMFASTRGYVLAVTVPGSIARSEVVASEGLGTVIAHLKT